MTKTWLTMLLSNLIMMKTPMTTLITLIVMTVVSTMMVITTLMDHWMGFLLILTYVSGLLILFMYLVSLTPNEKPFMKTTQKTTILLSILMLFNVAMPYMKISSILFSVYKTYKINMIWLSLILLVMVIISPKMIISTFKGMKTTS